MFIKIDSREGLLIQQIHYLIDTINNFKELKIKVETLDIGDVIICDDYGEKIIIERKSLTDLLASIKDGRYEEQSYRLNGLNMHNHNIMYLIEGYFDEINKFKSENKNEKLTIYSAMISLNYFKGFSVFRSFNIFETAYIICNIAYKLNKDNHKKPYYKNNINNINNINENNHLSEQKQTSTQKDQHNVGRIIDNIKIDKTEIKNTLDNINYLEDKINSILENNNFNNDLDINIQEKNKNNEKNYINVVKKVKKENITPENMAEIMLSQIPGISSTTAISILNKYKTLANLLKELENNPDCLKDITYTNNSGKIRKINKNCAENIIKYLIK